MSSTSLLEDITFLFLKADNLPMDGDGKLVGHAGDEFNDALVEPLLVGQIEHWLDGVKFQPGAHFRVVVGVLHQPVLEGGAQQGVLLEAEAYLLSGDVGHGLGQEPVDGVNDHCGVVLEFQKPPVSVDVGIVEGLELVHKLEVGGGEHQSRLRGALLAQVHNQVIDEDGGVHRLAGGEAEAFRHNFPQLTIGSHVQDVVPTGVLNVPAQIGNLVGKLHHATLPGVRLDTARLLDVVEGNGLAAGTDAALVHLAAMAHDAVPHGVGQIQVSGVAVRVLQCFDVVGKEEAVTLVPKSFWGIFAWLLG